MGAQVTGDAATHMDRIYRYQRHIYDASRKFFLLGRDHLLRELKPPPEGTVLEVGCGTGRNLIAAAKRWPKTTLFGFDISNEMLATARANVKRAGLEDRIILAQADAAGFDAEGLFDRPHFDRVFCSYTLSMIPPWRAASEQALEAVAPGGQLHVVDFGMQERLPRPFKAVLFKWLASFSVSPRPDLEDQLRRIAQAGDLKVEFKKLLRGYAYYAQVSRSAEA
ncbi:MAG: class I SAM-dependent methyltransferase [Pseudomonadota bacterium]